MEQAKEFIFLEYFSVYPGHMWGSILEVLSRKAKEGVEVRVLYDGMNAFTNLPYDYPRQLEQLGIQCKMFSPVRPFVSTH
ncbi:MAG: cardiolipin synthase, partial [Erysipelotrichaceae bacterium]|nr:cardiolipin synthase [Erysipelotrichaceae bacterium]